MESHRASDRISPAVHQLQELAAQSGSLLQQADNLLLKQAARWISLSEDEWQPLLEGLSDAELLALAEFYVKAEMTAAGFESGAGNPAIAVFRYLKRQGRLPGKEVIRALKAETTNRYIPYGKVML